MAIQFELLILPCIISITVALTWIAFLMKDVSRIRKSVLAGSFFIAWVSIALFTASLIQIMYIMVNIIQAYDITWAQTFVAGWILLFISIAVLHSGYIMRKD